ncbi:hypothetical protein BG841_00565 [Marinobacter sp. X15-166B]|nr:hypothetical protein BG841_00565 [Marinobacter sp. X15-166B]
MGGALILAAPPLAADMLSERIPSQTPLPATDLLVDAYAGLPVIHRDEMGEMRGGFSVAGLNLKFGATLSTVIDSIELQTAFNITAEGAQVVSQMLSDLGSMNDAALQYSSSSITGDTTVTDGSTRTVTGDASAVLVGPDTGLSAADHAPTDVSLDGLDNANGFSGVVVNSNKGFTAALHKLTQDAAISTIISNASDLKASHKLNIKIQVANTKAAGKAAKAAALSKLAGGMFSKH